MLTIAAIAVPLHHEGRKSATVKNILVWYSILVISCKYKASEVAHFCRPLTHLVGKGTNTWCN